MEFASEMIIKAKLAKLKVKKCLCRGLYNVCKTWPFPVTRNAFCTINTKTCKVCVKIGDKMLNN